MERMSSSPGSPYRLDELGWLQFDRLCSLVLEADAGLSDLHWRGHSDVGRVARVDDRVVLGKSGDSAAVAAYLLGATKRAWDQQYRPLPVFLLEAWYALNAGVHEPADPPLLGPTWADLPPGYKARS
jgi:hypothetical protein